MSNNTQPLLGSLGLCRKAGRLLHGHDRVLEAVLSGKLPLVLLAQDASERTARHLRDACEGLVPCRTMPLTAAELAGLTPKPAAVFGVTDENLARLCMSHIE